VAILTDQLAFSVENLFQLPTEVEVWLQTPGNSGIQTGDETA